MHAVRIWEPLGAPLGVDTLRWQALVRTVPVRPEEVAYRNWLNWRRGRTAPHLDDLEYTLRVLRIEDRVAREALGWSMVPVDSIHDIVLWIHQARAALTYQKQKELEATRPRRSSYEAVKRHRARKALALQRTFLGLPLPRKPDGSVDLRQLRCPKRLDPNAGVRPDILGFQDQEERDAALTAAHYKNLALPTEPDTDADTDEHENHDDQS